mmetsp:Transcript_8205/g.22862  ORF Transcript_8205/g.22862 Transcript_8205/m.22862 type:complete len:223 (+) Transcript_8205:296-964(+)
MRCCEKGGILVGNGHDFAIGDNVIFVLARALCHGNQKFHRFGINLWNDTIVIVFILVLVGVFLVSKLTMRRGVVVLFIAGFLAGFLAAAVDGSKLMQLLQMSANWRHAALDGMGVGSCRGGGHRGEFATATTPIEEEALESRIEAGGGTSRRVGCRNSRTFEHVFNHELGKELGGTFIAVVVAGGVIVVVVVGVRDAVAIPTRSGIEQSCKIAGKLLDIVLS